MLSHAVAKLAYKLKRDEKRAVVALGAPTPRDGISAALAAAELALINGRLAEAADTLEAAVAGTSAAGVVAQWAAQARARAAANQALRLLQAHATSLAASLA